MTQKNKAFARSTFALAMSLCIYGFAGASPTTTYKQLPGTVLTVLQNSKMTGQPSGNQQIELGIALVPREQSQLQVFVDQVSDPSSPIYRHFLTPDQVGIDFGATSADVQRVVSFLKSSGIKIDLVAKNRMAIIATTTVAQAEKAFQTKIENFIGPNPTGKTFSFEANSLPISVPTSIAKVIGCVSGLDTYMRPVPRTTLSPPLSRALYNTAPSYANGFQGQGMNIGYSNWDGYATSNAVDFINYFGLPFPSGGKGSNIHIVEITNGQNSNNTGGGGEGDLDMQMELSAAPLAGIYIYDDAVNFNPLNTYTREANDNICDALSESYGWSSGNSSFLTATHNEHLTMSAQGQTYMCASGDNGTSEINSYFMPDCDPEITVVGGTIATVNGNGQRTSEVSWSGSTGGWYNGSLGSPNFNVLPSWQKGSGVPTTINHRLVPDIGMHSQSGSDQAFYIFYGGQLSAIAGTSCASPWFTSGLSTLEQRLAANGQTKRFGRINDLIYSENERSDVWYDITTGSGNGTLPNGQASNPTTNWDFVTGWGAPNFDGWYNALSTSTVAPSSFTILTGSLVSGNLASLANNDSNYLVVNQGVVASSAIPPVQVVVQGVSTLASVSSLKFDLVAHTSSSLQQTIQLYDWTTLTYVTVSTTASTTSDSTIEVTASNPNRFIQSGTHLVQAKIAYLQTGPVTSSPWSADLNQTVWKVAP